MTLRNGMRVRITRDLLLLQDDDEQQYAGCEGVIDDEDADDSDYPGQYLIVNFPQTGHQSFQREALIPLEGDLLELAQQAVPELDWQPDSDGDVLCRTQTDAYTVYVSQDAGKYVVEHSKLGSCVSAAIAPSQISRLAAQQTGFKSLTNRIAVNRVWIEMPTAEQIAQFFKDSQVIWEEFLGDGQ